MKVAKRSAQGRIIGIHRKRIMHRQIIQLFRISSSTPQRQIALDVSVLDVSVLDVSVHSVTGYKLSCAYDAVLDVSVLMTLCSTYLRIA